MTPSFLNSSISRQLLASAAIGMLVILAFVLVKEKGVLSPKDHHAIQTSSGERKHPSSSTAPADETNDRFKSSRHRAAQAEPDPMERKLRSIIVPRIAFEDVTIAEAVDFIRLRSAEVMAENAQEESAGLASDSSPHRRNPLDDLDERQLNQRMTLQRRDISTWDAMSLIAREIGMKVAIVDGSVKFVK